MRQKKASRTDREQSGNIHVYIYIRGVQLTVYVCTVQVMIVKMTIHKGTKGKRQSHIDIPRDTKNTNTNISVHRFPLALCIKAAIEQVV